MINQYFLMYSSRRSSLMGFRSRQEAILMGEELKDKVRERYAGVARSVREGGGVRVLRV